MFSWYMCAWLYFFRFRHYHNVTKNLSKPKKSKKVSYWHNKKIKHKWNAKWMPSEGNWILFDHNNISIKVLHPNNYLIIWFHYYNLPHASKNKKSFQNVQCSLGCIMKPSKWKRIASKYIAIWMIFNWHIEENIVNWNIYQGRKWKFLQTCYLENKFPYWK